MIKIIENYILLAKNPVIFIYKRTSYMHNDINGKNKNINEEKKIKI